MVEDEKGSIWFSTSIGLDRFDDHTGQFTHYQHQGGKSNSLPDNDLHRLYKKPNGNLLIASGGI
ncbi:hypothetical protein [Spirosoma telluris]|uniref:hypothetical protein n=1 Tax=Spirosoma telluris TaxID=2183553 RepID=UPI0038CD391A